MIIRKSIAVEETVVKLHTHGTIPLSAFIQCTHWCQTPVLGDAWTEVHISKFFGAVNPSGIKPPGSHATHGISQNNGKDPPYHAHI